MSTTDRPTIPLMRFALLLGAVLTFASGLQLYVLTDHTDDFFAWTIQAGSSATIMGAFYWTACTLSFLSWRRRTWVLARVGVPGVAVFLWLTLLTTVLHLDKFHFDGPATAQFAAWAWLVIYIVDPILVTIALVLQWRSTGMDPPPAGDLGTAYRGLLVASAVVFLAAGLLMMTVPDLVLDLAAWPLTPLTSRAIGSWVVAMGVVFATMAWENDSLRIQPAAVASLVLVGLLVAGMVRYWSQFTWAAGWVHVAMVADIALIGVTGLLRHRSRTES